MPTYSYTPTPAPLTQEELDALAAQQQAMGGAVPAGGYQSAAAVPEPLVPAGTPAPPTQTVSYPTATGGGPAGAQYGTPEMAPGYGLQIPVAEQGPPPQPVYDPLSSAYQAAPMAASAYYGGPDPSAPPVSTGLLHVSYPATGRPPTSVALPSGPRAAQEYGRQGRFAGAAEDWAAHPVERRPPPPGYSPYNTGTVPGGPGNIRQPTLEEATAARAAYRLAHPPPPPRRVGRWEAPPPWTPTTQIVQPVPLPVAQDPGWDEFVRALMQEAGVWPFYRTPLQDALGAPLRGGGPPRSG